MSVLKQTQTRPQAHQAAVELALCVVDVVALVLVLVAARVVFAEIFHGCVAPVPPSPS